MMRSNTLRCLASLMLVAAPFAASAAVTQVAGEPSRTPAQAAPAWKLAQFPASSTIGQGYRELALERLVELGDRLIDFALLVEQLAAVLVGREQFRREFRRLVERLQRLVLPIEHQ